jgi:hypothetical protein
MIQNANEPNSDVVYSAFLDFAAKCKFGENDGGLVFVGLRIGIVDGWAPNSRTGMNKNPRSSYLPQQQMPVVMTMQLEGPYGDLLYRQARIEMETALLRNSKGCCVFSSRLTRETTTCLQEVSTSLRNCLIVTKNLNRLASSLKTSFPSNHRGVRIFSHLIRRQCEGTLDVGQ